MSRSSFVPMFTDRNFRALALSVLLASALEAATPGQEAYQAGYRAFMAGKWEQAVEGMRRAIQEDPREGKQRFKDKGLNKVDYFPQLYLGLALQELGRDVDALEALRESARQGVVPASEYAILLSRHLRELEARLAPPSQPIPTITPLATPPPPPLPAKPDSVQNAVIAESGRQLPVETPTRGARPRAVRSVASQTPRTPLPRPTISEPHALDAASVDSIQALRDGIRAYFAGSFEVAEGKLRPHVGYPPARLFLAYSMASRYLMTGKKDAALATEARDHFKRAKADGAQPPPGDVISPAVQLVLSESGM